MRKILLIVACVVALVILSFRLWPYRAAEWWNCVLKLFISDRDKVLYHDIIKDFTNAIPEIRDEYLRCQSTESIDVGTLSSFERNLAGTDGKWKMVPIKLLQAWQPSAERCPTLKSLITKHQRKISTVYYSVLEPGKELPFHEGPTKGVLRCHIPLIIPTAPDKGLEVKQSQQSQIYDWSVPFIFDDTLQHRAWNKTNETRVVLLMDLFRELPPIIDQLNRLWFRIASVNFE